MTVPEKSKVFQSIVVVSVLLTAREKVWWGILLASKSRSGAPDLDLLASRIPHHQQRSKYFLSLKQHLQFTFEVAYPYFNLLLLPHNKF